MVFVSNQGSHPFLPSLHCGTKEAGGIISSIKLISMDYVSNQGSHPFLPSFHCGTKEAGGIISSIKIDFDGLRLEPRFSSLSSFISLRRERDYLIN
jgi:hypothetical protein